MIYLGVIGAGSVFAHAQFHIGTYLTFSAMIALFTLAPAPIKDPCITIDPYHCALAMVTPAPITELTTSP